MFCGPLVEKRALNTPTSSEYCSSSDLHIRSSNELRCPVVFLKWLVMAGTLLPVSITCWHFVARLDLVLFQLLTFQAMYRSATTIKPKPCSAIYCWEPLDSWHKPALQIRCAPMTLEPLLGPPCLKTLGAATPQKLPGNSFSMVTQSDLIELHGVYLKDGALGFMYDSVCYSVFKSILSFPVLFWKSSRHFLLP